MWKLGYFFLLTGHGILRSVPPENKSASPTGSEMEREPLGSFFFLGRPFVAPFGRLRRKTALMTKLAKSFA